MSVVRIGPSAMALPVAATRAASRADVEQSAVDAAFGGASLQAGPPAVPRPAADFALSAQEPPPFNERLAFPSAGAIAVDGNMAAATIRVPDANVLLTDVPDTCGNEIAADAGDEENPLASLRPLGQVRESFIIAANAQGLWIIDQHTAHERVLFEKIMRERSARSVSDELKGQRLLMPLIVELTPSQWPVFAQIADELHANGFEVEPFGSRTIAVKTAPAGVKAGDIEKLLAELIEQIERESQAMSIETVRTKIAATVACHAAVKVNMPLEMLKMEWLVAELAKTECPMTCPHGRPVVLKYSVQEIQKAFKRTWGNF